MDVIELQLCHNVLTVKNYFSAARLLKKLKKTSKLALSFFNMNVTQSPDQQSQLFTLLGMNLSFARYSSDHSSMMKIEQHTLDVIQAFKVVLQSHLKDHWSDKLERRSSHMDVCFTDLNEWLKTVRDRQENQQLEDEEELMFTPTYTETDPNVVSVLNELHNFLFAFEYQSNDENIEQLISLVCGSPSKPICLNSAEVMNGMDEFTKSAVISAIEKIVHRIYCSSSNTITQEIIDSIMFCLDNLAGILKAESNIDQSCRWIINGRIEGIAHSVMYLLPIFARDEDDYFIQSDVDLPVLESKPTDREELSFLWIKLHMTESTQKLIDSWTEDECIICRDCVITCHVNFAILDNCRHLCCVTCATTLFKNRNTCPCCRTVINSWTTKEHFEAFKRARQERVGGPAVEQ